MSGPTTIRTRVVTHSAFILMLGATLVDCKDANVDAQPVGVPADQTALEPAAASDDAAPQASDLLPLQEGNTWTYRVTGQSATCAPGEHTRTIAHQPAVAGREVLAASGFCGLDEPLAFASDGSQVLQLVNGEWQTALANPLEEGHTYEQAPGSSVHWHKLGWVQVPAGLFAGCWELLPTDNYSSLTFCKDVGMVAMSGDALLVELTSFKLARAAVASAAQ